MEDFMLTPRRPTRALGELQRQTFQSGFERDQRLVPSSVLSPAPSPDELVIRFRGRRKVPLTYSPENETKLQRTPNKQVTPSKRGEVTPSKGTPPRYFTRQSPRKRLPLYDLSAMSPKKGSPNAKRPKFEIRPECNNAPVEVLMRGLSQPQLVNVLNKLLVAHPELKQEIDLPDPDIGAFEEQLNRLKKNIYRSLPSSRLASKNDSPAYNRASVHLLEFKKAIHDHGRTLTDSQQWQAAVRYSLIAFNYVRATPIWENATHNYIRRHCFRMLVNCCTMALKRGIWERSQLLNIKERLDDFVSEFEEIKTCLDLVTSYLDTATKDDADSASQKP
ncbi:uncharacterized protein LOC136028819 [Artemia franciscana]|uniref:uncharacterized protein LOC136028819 n=1 Tax=Artemia franciscana TaxID=6661 RepID=UPI0032DB20BF